MALVAAGVTAYQLSRPGLLFGVTPDVSVYVGAAVRLVHGAVPYRDFVFVQPPGFVLLATPVAALSELTGTRDALVALRSLTPLLAAATVAMMGQLIRPHGRAATLVACAVMALFPAELYAIRGPQLEPVVVFLCLAGAILAFNGPAPAGSRRLAVAGVVFGFAVAVKLSAALPLIVVAVLCARQARQRLLPFAAGAAAGFGIPALPFLLLAPGAFVRDALTTQLGRIPASGRVSLSVRLGDLTGASAFTTQQTLILAVAVVLAGFVIVAFAASRTPPAPLEWFALGATVTVALVQVAPAQYYPQYAALIAPFLALVLGMAVGRLGGMRARGAAVAGAAVAVAAFVTGTLLNVSSEAVPDVARAVDAVVPAGGCALSNSPVYLFTADRFQATNPGCTVLTDPDGTTLALSDGSEAVATWRAAFTHTDYVVTDAPIGAWELPTSAQIPTYVAANFRLVRSGGLLIYVRDSALVP